MRKTCPSLRLVGGCDARLEFGVRSPQPRDRCPAPGQRNTKSHLTPDWLISVKTGVLVVRFSPLIINSIQYNFYADEANENNSCELINISSTPDVRL